MCENNGTPYTIYKAGGKGKSGEKKSLTPWTQVLILLNVCCILQIDTFGLTYLRCCLTRVWIKLRCVKDRGTGGASAV